MNDPQESLIPESNIGFKVGLKSDWPARIPSSNQPVPKSKVGSASTNESSRSSSEGSTDEEISNKNDNKPNLPKITDSYTEIEIVDEGSGKDSKIPFKEENPSKKPRREIDKLAKSLKLITPQSPDNDEYEEFDRLEEDQSDEELHDEGTDSEASSIVLAGQLDNNELDEDNKASQAKLETQPEQTPWYKKLKNNIANWKPFNRKKQQPDDIDDLIPDDSGSKPDDEDKFSIIDVDKKPSKRERIKALLAKMGRNLANAKWNPLVRKPKMDREEELDFKAPKNPHDEIKKDSGFFASDSEQDQPLLDDVQDNDDEEPQVDSSKKVKDTVKQINDDIKKSLEKFTQKQLNKIREHCKRFAEDYKINMHEIYAKDDIPNDKKSLYLSGEDIRRIYALKNHFNTQDQDNFGYRAMLCDKAIDAEIVRCDTHLNTLSETKPSDKEMRNEMNKLKQTITNYKKELVGVKKLLTNSVVTKIEKFNKFAAYVEKNPEKISLRYRNTLKPVYDKVDQETPKAWPSLAETTYSRSIAALQPRKSTKGLVEAECTKRVVPTEYTDPEQNKKKTLSYVETITQDKISSTLTISETKALLASKENQADPKYAARACKLTAIAMAKQMVENLQGVDLSKEKIFTVTIDKTDPEREKIYTQMACYFMDAAMSLTAKNIKGQQIKVEHFDFPPLNSDYFPKNVSKSKFNYQQKVDGTLCQRFFSDGLAARDEYADETDGLLNYELLKEIDAKVPEEKSKPTYLMV